MSHALFVDIDVPLPRFNLSVRWETSGASLGLFGHSGSGKTTFLETLAGLRPGARGVIRVGGETWLDSSRDLHRPPELRGVGYVPQDGLLFPHRDVMRNLLSGNRRAGRSPQAISPDRVLEVLELTELCRRRVDALSGGERQRVALGRALCSGAKLLLLDEPLSGLDLPLRKRILPYLLAVRDEFRIPTLYVSHDATEILMLSEEVVVLSDGQVLALGSPREVLAEPSVFSMARAEGFENLLEGPVVELRDGSALVEPEPGIRLTVPGQDLAEGRRVTIGLRAEDLILGAQPPSGLSVQNVLPGTVGEIRETPDGYGEIVTVRLGRKQTAVTLIITSRARRQLALEVGMPVHVLFKAQACQVLAVR